jgi:hypothetical protein
MRRLGGLEPGVLIGGEVVPVLCGGTRDDCMVHNPRRLDVAPAGRDSRLAQPLPMAAMVDVCASGHFGDADAHAVLPPTVDR